MQEPPRVTITDPSRPDPGPVDELDEERPRSRRGLYAVLAVLVLLAAARGVDTVRDRRAAAAEERRLSAVVELELTMRSSGGREQRDRATDTATVERTVSLRNSGPRPVAVLGATVGPLVFAGSAVVQPGREVELALQHEVNCSTRPQPTDPVTTMVVELRTAGGELVEREVPLLEELFLSDPDQLRRACGYLAPQEAASVFPDGSTQLVDDAVLVDLFFGNGGRDPVELQRVGGGAGMRAELVDAAGRAVPLPLLLPPDSALGSVAGEELLPGVQLRLTVVDCDAVILFDPDSDVFDIDSAGGLSTLFGVPGQPADPMDTGFTVLEARQVVLDLLERSCP